MFGRGRGTQVDLQEWIHPLNKIDACISYFIQKYPAMLLIGPVKRTQSRGAASSANQLVSMPANSPEEVNSVPETTLKNLGIILHFLSGLMSNSSNKSVFNSVEELVDLLAAADDTIAGDALEVLCNLSTPPALHKQQAPELQQHTTALHSSRTTSHKRLVAMARGWGTRGSGLGLYTCSAADDSEFGQGALPKEAGELHFTFFRRSQSSEEKKSDSEEMNDSLLVELSLLKKDIIDDSAMVTDTKISDDSDESSSGTKQKRRRVAPVTLGEEAIRSTPCLFFECLEKAGGRDQIPDDRLFPLLSDIRLARSFHCRTTRIAALERRLRAIITILYAHPSQEIMSGYFQAQPELCVEMIDLLRPTVSSASVSAASSRATLQEPSSSRQDAISALANSPAVPYELRELALQALTALVGRRDGTTGALTGVARHSNVLSELGVGKGQYLGLLPTLIRFSLASLSTIVSSEEKPAEKSMDVGHSEEEAIALDIGLAFVQAVMPPPLPRNEQLLKALEFIDSVLTLTSAVVSTQSGTAALTECGLIPALLATVTIDHEDIFEKSGLDAVTSEDANRMRALFRFISAQAVQIIEGAIVTQTNALTAFHDMNGVEVLTKRLSQEILATTTKPLSLAATGAVAMDIDTEGQEPPLHCSQRVLLFSIVTCLTVVFHQESTSSSSVITPSGAAQLRKPDLTAALICILDNIEAYGGHLVSLIATLLADVMNSDPHVVRHVHDSGLAKSFLAYFRGGQDGEPLLPPVPELIMAVPNVISALALTEDGASAIKDADPFPALLKIFYHPKYAMPRSKCLLNEMTAIVGTGLDEIMRHTSILKPLVCAAIANAMNRVTEIGENLAAKEKEEDYGTFKKEGPASEMENERSYLMQYALNFGQLLEQILHNEDHCSPFVAAGGLDALLRLYPCLMPTGREFLSHISCLSCPSVSTLSHSASEDAMALAFRCIALRYDPFELVKTLMNHASSHAGKLEELQLAMRNALPSQRNNNVDGCDATFVLDGLPCETVYDLLSDPSVPSTRRCVISDYLRQVVTVQWITSFLSSAIKAACQRGQEVGSGWSRQEREWKKELSSTSFEELVGRLRRFHQSALFEACRVRTEDGFEEREKERRKAVKRKGLRYRLRIVCPEGAVVRDGIEIDSCASVGNMEMGEIVQAFDRCVNSSGVMRYRTARGWLSEQTRGHGREPIAEVLSVWEVDEDAPAVDEVTGAKARIETGVPDMRTTGANILARLQSSYAELFAALSKVVVQGIRTLPVRTLSFQQGTMGAHVATIMRILKSGISEGFNLNGISNAIKEGESPSSINLSGASMYLGCMVSHLRACLFEEKRDRRTVNVPLLIALSNDHKSASSSGTDDRISVFVAMQFIFDQALHDFQERAQEVTTCDDPRTKIIPKRRQSRTTAASLPAVVAVLKRLTSGPAITSSPVATVLSRVKLGDLPSLLGDNSEPSSLGSEETFSPEIFFREVLSTVSDTIRGIWADSRFVFAPPFVAHPIVTLVSEIITGLEDSTKKTSLTTSARTNLREESGLWNAFRGLVANRVEGSSEQDFEPSEEAVTRLMEMGFSSDHSWVAIDSTRSNQLEIAMEYALSHPPPSPREVERRRNAAAERRRQREQRSQANESTSGDAAAEPPAANANGTQEEISAPEAMEVDQATSASDEKKPADESLAKAQSQLQRWKVEATRISCDILAGLKTVNTQSDAGDGDGEAFTVVLASFLLDICQRYPDDRESVAAELVERLGSQITEKEVDKSVEFSVSEGYEYSFSALCHATVLFTRALPKTRTLVLKHCLIQKIICCIQNVLKPCDDPTNNISPVWLAPSLLLLDIMAQPIVAFPDKEKVTEAAASIVADELQQVEDEHRKQAEELSILARDLFLALGSGNDGSSQKKSIVDESKTNPDTTSKVDESKVEEAASESGDCTEDLLFKGVPAYFPLLPIAALHKCADICLQVLESGQTSPGVIHATLLLLLRLLRAPSISSDCAKAGLAEKILSLPHKSRFTGHSGLVTLIFRRLLEDEHTLQVAMETEIRGIISKFPSKSNATHGSEEKNPSVPKKNFVQAITPLLCREPSSFLKAVAVTVLFEKGRSEDASDGKVTLLSPQSRARNLRIVSDLLKKRRLSHAIKSPLIRRSSMGKSKKSNGSPRSKTPVRSHKRGHTPKRAKKEKAEHKERKEEEMKGPALSVTNLLINYVIKSSFPMDAGNSSDDKIPEFGFEINFLWTADVIGILSDLVLAIPACATSIHRFRPSKSKSNRNSSSVSLGVQHALGGCPAPPKTFVSFLLHSLLIQDRSCISEHQLWDEQSGNKEADEEKKKKKQFAFRRTKVSQASARLLFALVARPGEGRRRVITELVFALSGGLLGLSGASPSAEHVFARPRSSEVHAIQAWGELCIGLAAPRNSGNNYDGNTTLSFEVIRMMLDAGVAHALLIAMHRVPLSHPRATSVMASLMLPFEVLTRTSVNDAVKQLVEKDTARDLKGSAKAAKSSTADHRKDRNDSFADDHMLEDAFAVQASREEAIDSQDIGDRFIDTEELHPPRADEPDQFIINEGEPHMEEVEMEENHMEMDEDIEEDEDSDGSMSSSEDSGDSSDGDEEDSEEDEDDDDDDDDEEEEDGEDDDSESIIEDDESPHRQDFENESDLNAEYRDDMLVENPNLDVPEEGMAERGEQMIDGGWQRIESNGFGGMLLGSRRGLGQQLGGNVSARTRGFIDAAEAMIGTLLRTGEIHGDALAEIEGSLGIRIVNQSGNVIESRPIPGGPAAAAFGNQSGISRGVSNGGRNLRGAVGTLPQINQRNQPDLGYSNLGDGRRWTVSSMEYVYGGPTMNAGSSNYDLIPRAIEINEETVPTISQIDAPLFPGGPASVAHSRTQHSLHPLLCGVDLPPLNALVSDLLPHGVRETHRGQLTARSTTDWTSSSLSGGFLVSTSNGNIVRSNRGATGITLAMNAQSHAIPGPVGWTDDGLPFDSTVEEFSSAFERALGDAMASQVQQDTSVRAGETTLNSGETDAARSNDEGHSADGNADAPMADAPHDAASGTDAGMANDNADASDGDGVASSLAAGLRLSPHGGANDHASGSGIDAQVADSEAPESNVDSGGDGNAAGANAEESPLGGRNGESNDNVEPSRGETGSDGDGAQLQHEPSNENALVCPPDVDLDVFNALPPDMQREVVAQAQATADVASQLDAGSSLDPEALAALPEDVRREVMEQEQRERRMHNEAPADPANAEEMDNASFIASLSPELREEILLTAEDAFLQSLPANFRTEAQILRERASINHRRTYEEPTAGSHHGAAGANPEDGAQRNLQGTGLREQTENGVSSGSRRKQRAFGKIRVESDRDTVVYLSGEQYSRLSPPLARADLEGFLRLLYLLSPVRPQKMIQKVFQNMTSVPRLRRVLTSALIRLLHDDNQGAISAFNTLQKDYEGPEDWRSKMDAQFGESLNDFPPLFLIGAAPEVLETDGLNPSLNMIRRKQTSDTVASIAANLPMSARGSRHERYLPPVVATRIVDTLQNICKNSPRYCINILVDGLVDGSEMEDNSPTAFDRLLDLLEKPRYTKSSANLEQLLVLLEVAVSPLSNLPKHGEEVAEVSQKEIDTAASSGKEWIDVPRIVVSQERLQLLCSILRMETCRDTSFTKVNTIARRLCRIDANRGYVLAELASVARALGADAIRDLKALSIRMSNAAENKALNFNADNQADLEATKSNSRAPVSASSSVAVSTSTSELKLLRVLQTLQALCTDVVDETSARKDGNVYVTTELVHLLNAMELDDLWSELSSCLKIVQRLEGVRMEEGKDTSSGDGSNQGDDENAEGGTRLQNSVAGLLTRFLPSIESFFVANASANRSQEKASNDGVDQDETYHLVGGNRLIEFATSNKILLNALVRNNSSLLDKGLKALVHVPRCRHLLDFDVKRHWFKTQVRRLRQHASRRHGSLRLHISRRNVLIDAYHQLRLRNADEMRGRLHITFRDEQGVDAGGLSREFFGILAKEIFNPNYALFTSTEDGSTFQPNPNSSINPDHLSYFRFVGRIVGKAVLDGYLLDAHFTRSLYKHMLGIKPTHHDMEAIDPDYYKNLKTILEYNLGDLGLELTFSIEDHSFGRSRMIDLLSNGRNVPVTEENKAKYVSLVCQHRMTTAISSQINAFLDGFHELVSRDLITIFTPRELELLISGLPDIDVHDLKKNTDYVGWKSSDQQIQWFWNVLFSLSRNQKAAFLQFVTGSSKVPLAGFGELPGMRGVQKFSIHKAGGASGALMSAHTCFNSLDLPAYSSEEELKEKLLYAITEGGGTFLLA